MVKKNNEKQRGKLKSYLVGSIAVNQQLVGHFILLSIFLEADPDPKIQCCQLPLPKKHEFKIICVSRRGAKGLQLISENTFPAIGGSKRFPAFGSNFYVVLGQNG